MNLLEDIVWAFNEIEYESMEHFSEKVQQYQSLILKEKAVWKPDEILVNSAKVDISYMVWTDKDSMAENETLLEEEDFFYHEENSEDGLFQAEIDARFEADNGKNFSALELLFKIDEQMKTKELGDHLFFEGLSSDGNDGSIPRYFLECGS